MKTTANNASVSSEKVFLDCEAVQKNNRRYHFRRRFRDIALSVIGILIGWPFMLLVALIIVIDSPGASPIYSQTRVGLDGKQFVFYKFRTMHPNAEKKLESLMPYNEMQGPVFKIKNDPRITRVGRFLRKSSIDELPQLINVIRGDMSIVGPRPGLPREVEQYDDYERQRLMVRPGLTCYWQIQPKRNKLGFDQWVKMDIQYIKERNSLTDWKIIAKTFCAVLGMNGE